jgi:hypothetical protein
LDKNTGAGTVRCIIKIIEVTKQDLGGQDMMAGGFHGSGGPTLTR